MDSAEQAALGDHEGSQQTVAPPNEAFFDAREINQYAPDGRLVSGSKELLMRTLRRFDRMPVNLTYSTILRMANGDLNGKFIVFKREELFSYSPLLLLRADLKSTYGWTAHLDPLFANNIERDPALSWQYFGSTTGLLRRFPGTSWPPEGFKSNQELNDFRSEDWFIQAVSSPKDIVSLREDFKNLFFSFIRPIFIPVHPVGRL